RGISAERLEKGYWRAYRDFYRWGSILRGAATKSTLRGRIRHAAYAAGWKKFEPLWDWLIRLRRVGSTLPVLETVLSGSLSRALHPTPSSRTSVPALAQVTDLARPEHSLPDSSTSSRVPRRANGAIVSVDSVFGRR